MTARRQAQDIAASLKRREVPQAEHDELLSLLARMRSDIVEVDSDTTGTPLPDAFRPATE